MTRSWGDLVAGIWQNPSGRAGLIGLGLLALASALGPLLLQNPNAMPDLAAGATAPSLAHPFGTDPLNRDLLARVLGAGRISLTVAALAVLLSMTIGTTLGLAAGYLGGWLDAVIMRIVDGALAIPRLFLLLLLLVVWDRIPLGALVLALGTTGWFATTRLARAEALRLKELGYVAAAEALGAGRWHTIGRHLAPNALGPVLVAATLGVGEVILLEAGLSFLGVGVRPPTPSWGGMVLEARPVLSTAPWAALFPGLAITVAVLAVNLVAGGVRAALDPRRA